MSPKNGQKFRQIIKAVAPVNTRALAKKARLASSLAKAYPQLEERFNAIEDAALRQLFRIHEETRSTFESPIDVVSTENEIQKGKR